MKRIFISVITLTALVTGSLLAVDVEPTAKEYARRTVNPTSLGKTAASATIGEIRNAPHEWGRGWSGFGKRVASAIGTHAVKGAIHMGVSKALHEQIDYQRSDQQGFKPRLKHALLATVVTRKTTTGAKTPNIGNVSGAVGAGFISRLWQPARLHTVASGASTSGILLGVDAGSNVAREFWPEIRHPKRARQNAKTQAAIKAERATAQ